MTERNLTVAPNGRKIVAACGLMAVAVGIESFSDDGITPDFAKIKPVGGPQPVLDPAGYLMLIDEDGNHWSASELYAGQRDDSALHHQFNDLRNRLIN